MSAWQAPTWTETSKPFWDALGDGELHIPYCTACERFFFSPRRWCPACWTDRVEWRRASGRGVVWSHTTAHVPFQGVDPADVPYTALLVDLDEGVRIPALLAASSAEVATGDRVELSPIVGKSLAVFRAAT
jgi:uncharacterized OB-fold protein